MHSCCCHCMDAEERRKSFILTLLSRVLHRIERVLWLQKYSAFTIRGNAACKLAAYAYLLLALATADLPALTLWLETRCSSSTRKRKEAHHMLQKMLNPCSVMSHLVCSCDTLRISEHQMHTVPAST